jgi:hypothetical protein
MHTPPHLSYKNVQKLSSTAQPFFQPKLTVNTPVDAHEQEADHVADQVMRMRSDEEPIAQRMPLTPVCSIQRKCSKCEENEQEKLYRKESGSWDPGGKAAPSVVGNVLSSDGGQPMDGGTLKFMESRFGQDFSSVFILNDYSKAAVKRKPSNPKEGVPSRKNFSLQSTGLQPQREYQFRLPRVQNNDYRMRVPAMETAGIIFHNALASPGIRLNESQRAAALEVFGSAVNLDPVRIVESEIVSAPTTLGNTIRVKSGSPLDLSTFIHEMAHVWQYQTSNSYYISSSVMHQTLAAITKGSRDAAYHTDIVAGKSIHSYTAEQQAVIIESWYSKPKLRSDPDYDQMIAEVRTTSPSLMTDTERYQEALYGEMRPLYHNHSHFELNPRMIQQDKIIPLLRFEGTF